MSLKQMILKYSVPKSHGSETHLSNGKKKFAEELIKLQHINEYIVFFTDNKIFKNTSET